MQLRVALSIPYLSYVLRAARPDGTDIVWPVEVDDSNGTLRYRYPLGPPPFGTDLTNSSGNSSGRFGDADRRRRAAIKTGLWPGGIIYYSIGSNFSGGQKRLHCSSLSDFGKFNLKRLDTKLFELAHKL